MEKNSKFVVVKLVLNVLKLLRLWLEKLESKRVQREAHIHKILLSQCPKEELDCSNYLKEEKDE